jgi:hypothetical protein
MKEGELARTGKGATRRKQRSAEGDDTTLHLRLTPEDQKRLRAIVGRMLVDPEVDQHERVSYAGAVRYAIRLCVERPPVHGKQEGS